MSQTTALQLHKVRTVGVPANDSERSLAFYRDVLGFEVRLDAPFGPGLRWIEVAPSGSDATIALAPPPPGQPASGRDTGIRLETGNADADHAALQAQGVDVDGEVMRLGGGVPPMFAFRDPDGNQLYVVESMPA